MIPIDVIKQSDTTEFVTSSQDYSKEATEPDPLYISIYRAYTEKNVTYVKELIEKGANVLLLCSVT